MEALCDEMLRQIGKHLKVVVVQEWPFHRGSTSPARTYHRAGEGVFYIHETDVTYDVLVHEFGHLVAWHFAGRPEGNDFGCGMTGDKGDWSLKAEDLEWDACCIEVTLRRRHGEELDKLTHRMLNSYSYEDRLKWVEGEGYVGSDEFMQETFARGEALLTRWAEEA
jgi:hypothetical protein